MSRTSTAVVALLALGACAEPDVGAMFNHLDVRVADGPEEAAGAFVDVIDAASTELHVGLPSGDDTTITDAILDAWNAGVAVQVVTDLDVADSAGITDLIASGVPVTLADDGIGYFDFSINNDVAWSSQETLMTHAYAVADRRRLVGATHAGDLDPGTRILVDAIGEELIEDVLLEHNQVFGGADAVSTTAYDGLAKSIVDDRWAYPTDSDVVPEVWFGPQERTTKQVIDAVWRSTSSVWVLTDDFANDGLAYALQVKASQGFDVQVVVGPRFGETSSLQSNELEDATPDVVKYRVDTPRVPTIVLVDLVPGPLRSQAVGLVLTHDLYSSARLYRGREVVNDQLIDGTLWKFCDATEDPSGPLPLLVDVFEAYRAEAEAL